MSQVFLKEGTGAPPINGETKKIPVMRGSKTSNDIKIEKIFFTIAFMIE